MNPYLLLLCYCTAVVASSLLGGALPSWFRLTHVRMQCLLSLVGGFVLGVALLHMIPHGVAACGSLEIVVQWTLVGLLFTFFLIRLFHFHQHGPETQPTELGAEAPTNVLGTQTSALRGSPLHSHSHGHDDAHPHDHSHEETSPHGRESWTGVLLGLSLHTLMDGIAMASAVAADAALHSGHHHAWPHGFGVFLAVFLHKPLDALSITGLLMRGDWSERKRRYVNLGFALMCPLGAVLFMVLSATAMPASLPLVLGIGLGFSAGVFLCISLSDLLPELQFHRHDRVKLSLSLLLGVGLAYAIGALEDPATHGHGPAAIPGAESNIEHGGDHNHDHAH